MSNEHVVRVTITGQDNLTRVLDNVVAGVEQTKKSFDFTAAIIAMESLVNGADRVQSGVKGMYGTMDSFVQSAFTSAISVRTIFGDAADGLLEFSKTADQTVGLSEKAFNRLVTPIGGVLTQVVGLTQSEAADWAIRLAERASDLAFVFDTDVATALDKVVSGLQGQMRPLADFGIGINAAMVETKALEMTGRENADSLTLQEKAMARLELIMEQTSGIAGSYADNTHLLFNQQQQLNASLENQRAEIGQRLLPVQEKLLGMFVSLPREVQMATVVMGAFGGDAIKVAGGLGQMALGLQGLMISLPQTTTSIKNLISAGAGFGALAGGITLVAAAAIGLNAVLEKNKLPEWTKALEHIIDPAEQYAYILQQLEGDLGNADFQTLKLAKSTHESAEAAAAAKEFQEQQALAAQELMESVEALAQETEGLERVQSRAQRAAEAWEATLEILDKRLEDVSKSAFDAFNEIRKLAQVPTVETEALRIELERVEIQIRAVERARRAHTDASEEELEAYDKQIEALGYYEQSLRDEIEALEDSISVTILDGLQKALHSEKVLENARSHEDLQREAERATRLLLDEAGAIRDHIIPRLADMRGGLGELNAMSTKINIDTSDIPPTVDLLETLGARARGFGTMVMRGFKEGIEDELANTRHAIEIAADNIGGAFTRKWGINSPSSVFYEYGVFTMAGLRDGLNANTESVIGVFTAMMNTIQDTSRRTLDSIITDSLARYRDLGTVATDGWTGIRNTADRFSNEILSLVNTRWPSIQDGILGPYRGASSGISSIMDGFNVNVRGGLNKVVDGLNRFSNGFTNAINWLSGQLNLGNVMGFFSGIPFLASGGTVLNSGLAWVGEKGPELVALSRGATVMPHERSVDFLKALSPDKAIGGLPGLGDAKKLISSLASPLKTAIAEVIRMGAEPLMNQAFRIFGLGAPAFGGVFQAFGPRVFAMMRDALFAIVKDWIEAAKQSVMGTGILGRPLTSYTVTQEFGMTDFAASGAYGGSGHSGIDLAAPEGTPIYAADTGRVTSAGWNGGYGNFIAIVHNGLRTTYGHLSRIATALNEIVTKGDIIGAVGSTGYSTGPHLHFEVYDNGYLANPRQFVQFRDGIARLPNNMLAYLHKDEAVIPAAMNPFVSMPSLAMSSFGGFRNASPMGHGDLHMHIDTVIATNDGEARASAATLGWAAKQAIEIRSGARL